MSTITESAARGESIPSWLLLSIAGLVAIVAGVLLIVQPAATATFLLLALGVYWLVTGALAVLGALTNRDETWGWRVFGGLCGMLAGIVLVLQPQVAAVVTLIALYVFVALAAFGIGIFEIISGLSSHPRDWGQVGLGALQIVMGILLFAFATNGAVALFVPLLGLSTVASGAILLGSGLMRRGQTPRTVESTA